MKQTKTRQHRTFRRRESGAALVVGMVMLALLSLLGLTAAGTSVMEQRMAANARDRTRAFEAAEAGLLACEARLPALRHVEPVPEQTGLTAIPLLAAQPQCTVGRAQTVSVGNRSLESAAHEQDIYQIWRLTVTAVGISPNTRVVLESHVRQRL